MYGKSKNFFALSLWVPWRKLLSKISVFNKVALITTFSKWCCSATLSLSYGPEGTISVCHCTLADAIPPVARTILLVRVCRWAILYGAFVPYSLVALCWLSDVIGRVYNANISRIFHLCSVAVANSNSNPLCFVSPFLNSHSQRPFWSACASGVGSGECGDCF